MTPRELAEHAANRIPERAAVPKHVEIMAELPKTAVGKVFKPDLRRMAITRVFDETLKEAKLDASVAEVIEDKKRGLVAKIRTGEGIDQAKLTEVLGEFAVQWDKI